MCEIRVVEAKREFRSLLHRDYFCFLRDSKVKTVLHLITGGCVGYLHTNSFRNRSFGWQNVWSDESDSGTLSRGGTVSCEYTDNHKRNILEKLAELTAAKCDFL